MVYREDFIRITTTLPEESAIGDYQNWCIGKRNVLENHELIRSLKADANALTGLCDIVDFNEDDTIVFENAKCDCIYIIIMGTCRVIKSVVVNHAASHASEESINNWVILIKSWLGF